MGGHQKNRGRLSGPDVQNQCLEARLIAIGTATAAAAADPREASRSAPVLWRFSLSNPRTTHTAPGPGYAPACQLQAAPPHFQH